MLLYLEPDNEVMKLVFELFLEVFRLKIIYQTFCVQSFSRTSFRGFKHR
jgi:hypothetical protein